MTPKKIPLQNLKLNKRYEELKKLSGSEFPKIKKFIDKAKNGETEKGVDISEATERKYIDALSMAYRSIEKKELCKLTKKDLTKLKQDLKSGKIQSRFKQSYSVASQREMETTLIRFLESINPKFLGFRKWFIVKVPKKDVEFLREEEIIKLYNACKSNEERYLIAVLFDAGFRASEFINIRFEDITKPTQSFPYYKINIKHEYSKTEGRNIGLYWKHSTEAIRDYLEEREGKLKEQVYTKTYDAIRLFLTRLGKKVLDKRLYFHIFRKSSATYYASKLRSRQQLCYRYGWKFSSDVPDVYINRELGEEEVKDSMLKTSQEKLEKENQELKTKQVFMDEKIDKINEMSKESLESTIFLFEAVLTRVKEPSKRKFMENLIESHKKQLKSLGK